MKPAAPDQMAHYSTNLRRALGRISIMFNVGRRWSKPEEQPSEPAVLSEVPLYAFIPTWCEEDVIASTVANAFAQGCDRVFIVDNESPDGTVERAKKAGAEIARIYHTDYWDDVRKMAEINTAIEEVSRASGEPHIWWMLCDADEFPRGPGGETVAEYLAGLDQRFRVVGARVFNHFPSGWPQYVEDRHPLDFQPLCQEVRMAWCSLRHWKHPLVRWDRDGHPIVPRVGFHRVDAAVRLAEPRQGIYLHHFPFRDEVTTRRRLDQLCRSEGAQPARTALENSRQRNQLAVLRRYANVDHVYAGRWDQVERPAPGGHKRGVKLRHWTEQVPSGDRVAVRWYPAPQTR